MSAPTPIPVIVPVAVIGAAGRLGGFACELLESTDGFELVGRYDQDDDWPSAVRSAGALVGFEATRAGQGFEHGLALLDAGVRPVVGTSGVSPEQNAELDRRACEAKLGGLVVPNFSLGIVLLKRAVRDVAAHFPSAEIVDLHHERKADAPSGTGADLARDIAEVRGANAVEVPIHSVRMPGYYAHHEVLFGAPGETLTLRHDMSSPAAFAPGILAAVRYAATAAGVARGLEAALE